MKTITLYLLLIISSLYTEAQTRYLPLHDFKFNGVTAQYQDDTTTVYSLLCTGSPHNSAKTDSLIDVWRSTHTDATLRPVCSFSYYNNMGNRITFTYSWIVSNEKTDPSLNVYLVRYGGCNAASMFWAKSSSILKPTIDYYIKKRAETKVFINASTYKSFIRELKKAQSRVSPHKNSYKRIKD